VNAAAPEAARRIVLTNAVLSNTGDAAIAQAIVGLLIDSGLISSARQVTVFDANARATRRLYPEWQVEQQLTVSPPREPARLRAGLQRARARVVGALARRPRWARRALRLPLIRRSAFARSYAALHGADLAVSSGGTYLVDHYNFAARVQEFELMQTMGLPVVLWTQSLGPFASLRSSALMRRAEPCIDGVYFRDKRSADAWASLLGEPQRGGVCADAVFALPAPARPAAAESDDDRPVAVISVREWGRGVDGDDYDRGAYRDMLRFAADRLARAGWRVNALSTCQGVPSYAYDDAAAARTLLDGLPVDIDAGFHTPSQLLRELSAVDLVITTRMHLAIMALLCRRPVIAVAYEFKTVELFQSLGLGRFVVRIEDCSTAWIDERITQALATPDALRLSAAELDRLRADAGTPASAVRDLLPSP